MDAEKVITDGNPTDNDADGTQRELAIHEMQKLKEADEAASKTAADSAEGSAEKTVDESETAVADEKATEESKKDDSKEKAAIEVKLPETQQIKLRVRQEAQKIRAQAQKERQEAEKIRIELEKEKQAAENARLTYEKQTSELAALKTRAKESPADFLTDAGTSLDKLVRSQLEAGRPDARISALEQQIAALVQNNKEQEQRAIEREKAVETEKQKAKQETEHAQLLQQKEQAEQSFLKLLVADPAKYPVLARVAKAAPNSAIAQGYVARNTFLAAEGREPTLEEIALNAESVFAEQEEAKQPIGKKGLAPVGAGGPRSPIRIEDMTEEQRRTAALAEMRKIRAAGGDS